MYTYPYMDNSVNHVINDVCVSFPMFVLVFVHELSSAPNNITWRYSNRTFIQWMCNIVSLLKTVFFNVTSVIRCNIIKVVIWNQELGQEKPVQACNTSIYYTNAHPNLEVGCSPKRYLQLNERQIPNIFNGINIITDIIKNDCH